jgi:hypothetical protein
MLRFTANLLGIITTLLFYIDVFFYRFDNYVVIERVLLVVFANIFVLAYTKTRNFFSLYVLFLISFFIFNLGLVLFNVFAGGNFGYTESIWLKGHSFSSEIKAKFLVVTMIAIQCIHLGAMVGYDKYKSKDKIYVPSSMLLSGLSISKIILFFGLCSFVIKIVLYLKVMMAYGYNQIYSYNLPLFIKATDDFFYIGFVFIIASKPPREMAKKLSIIYVLLSASYLFIGFRGPFFTSLMTVLWAYSFLYSYRPNITKIFFVGVLTVVTSQIVLITRYDIGMIEQMNMLSFLNFFMQQGISINILGFLIDFQDEFTGFVNGFHHVFAPIKTQLMYVLGYDLHRSIDTPSLTGLLSHELSFYFNPTNYLSYGGVGSNFIAELYSFNNILIFILGSFMYGFLLSYLSENVARKAYGVALVMTMLPRVLFSPRDNFLGFVQPVIFFMIFYVLYKIIVNAFLEAKREDSAGERNIAL